MEIWNYKIPGSFCQPIQNIPKQGLQTHLQSLIMTPIIGFWTNTLNFNKTYDKHAINALVGIEAVENRIKQKTINVTGFLFETPDFYLLDRGSGTPNFGFVGDVTNSLFSVFGSLNYAFDNKYLLTATLRRDTSSNFLGDNRSDVFPAVSAGWQVSDEDWFDSKVGK